MKILYNQSRLNKTLFLGIAYILIGIMSIFLSLQVYLSGFAGIGIVFIINYFFLKNRTYVTLTENTISKNGLLKIIEIQNDKIISAKYFAGDYIIKTSSVEFIIDTNLVDKISIPTLRDYFEKYIARH